MRDTLEFKIEGHQEHKVIAIVPIVNSSDYWITMNGKVKYGGSSFPLAEAKEKVDFLRKFLNIQAPIMKSQDGKVLPPKRKRRTKAEMEVVKRENDRKRTNRIKSKKSGRRTPKTKKHR